MSVKIALLGISGFIDLALLPIRAAFGHPAQSSAPGASRKVVLITPAADGVSVENSVCLGGLDACQTAALELMEEKRKIALEGFHLEEVAALCFKLNYRWRFDGSRDQRLRFIVEPGVQSPLPDGRPRPASDSSSGGRD